MIGKFKDEVAGQQISHFVGLRAKLYSFKIEDSEVKKAKGNKKNVITKEISFDDYKKMPFFRRRTNETNEYNKKSKS